MLVWRHVHLSAHFLMLKLGYLLAKSLEFFHLLLSSAYLSAVKYEPLYIFFSSSCDENQPQALHQDLRSMLVWRHACASQRAFPVVHAWLLAKSLDLQVFQLNMLCVLVLYRLSQ